MSTQNDQHLSGADELRQILRGGTKHFLLVFLFSVFVNLLMLTGPLFMMQVYDRVLGSRSQETLGALFILVAALFALMGVLEFARGRVAARFGAWFQNELDGPVFEATLAHAIVPRNRVAAATGLKDLETVQTFCASPVLLAMMDIPWAPIFIAGLFIFNQWMGWFAVIGGGLLVILAIISQIVTHRRLSAAEHQANVANGMAEQSRRATELIRSQGMGPDMKNRWQAMRLEALVGRTDATDRIGAFSSLTKAFRMFLQSAILALGAYLVLHNQITAGAMIAGSILLGRALAPIEQCIGNWRQIERASSAYKTLNAFLEKMPAEPAKTTLPPPKPELTVKGLYIIPPGTNVQTLKNVSFQLEPGLALGVIGYSGSGKTTLAKAILGLWPPAAGEIRLDGAELKHYDRTVLGKMIGYLPQEVILFTGTIAENIARMSRTPDHAAVVKAAQKANAHELILSLPEGYDTVLAGNDSLLSGGQKQRIGLARALYGEPILLVLDEPNSALDAEGSHALNMAVRGMKAEGKSVIIMTHRPTAISECDKLLVIKNGLATAFGDRDEVLKSTLSNAEDVNKQIQSVGAS